MGGTDGEHTLVCKRRTRLIPEKVGQVFGPGTKLAGSDAPRVIRGFIDDVKNSAREEFGDWAGHAGKALHKEVDGVLAE